MLNNTFRQLSDSLDEHYGSLETHQGKRPFTVGLNVLLMLLLMVFSYHNHCLVSNPRLVSPSSCSKREKKCSIILAHLTGYTTKYTVPKKKKKKKGKRQRELE